MTVDQVIALSASLAAAVSAFATFRTVREMQKQRELAHRPELVLLPMLIKATEGRWDGASGATTGKAAIEKPNDASGATTGKAAAEKPNDAGGATADKAAAEKPNDAGGATANAEDTVGLLSYWQAQSGSDLFSSGSDVAVALSNIGLGGAKSIDVEWDLPMETFCAEINAMAQRTLTPAFYEYRDELLNFKSESLGEIMMMWRNNKKGHVDFVLPGKAAQGDNVALRIPCEFVHLVSAYLFFFMRSDKKAETPFRIPPLSLKLMYSDIAGIEHRDSFLGEFDPIMFHRKECMARIVFRRQRSKKA